MGQVVNYNTAIEKFREEEGEPQAHSEDEVALLAKKKKKEAKVRGRGGDWHAGLVAHV